MNTAEDAATDRLERRWFAAFRAASAARAECEALLEQREQIEATWNQARVRLAEIEAMRDALGDELMQMEGQLVAAGVPVVYAATFAA
jgi:chromosome segregation ATPase